MADVKWIKITTTMFEDEKIDFIESLPESDAILIIWIKLLAQAGKTNSNGFIFLTEQIPYTDEMLSHKFRRTLSVVKLALQTLKRLEMIEYDDSGFLRIANWEKHQNIEGLEKIREQTRKRVAKHRETQKELASNVTVTQGNETDIDIDKELDIDKDNTIIMTSEESKFIKILSKIPKYPLDREKDLEMYKTLEERYPLLNLVEAVEDWKQYKLDKPLKDNSNARSQINTSFKNYMSWGKCLKEATNGGDRTRTSNINAKTTEQGEDIAKRAGVISL